MRDTLLRRGLRLEYATLGWNVVGVAVLALAAIQSGSAAAAGFGLDSAIEIGASLVVVWELTGAPAARQRHALRLIGVAFLLVATYLLVDAVVVVAGGHHPGVTLLGLAWTAATCVVMLTLARHKDRVGRAIENPVLRAESRVTLVDAALAAVVVVGLTLNAAAGWWWADPLAVLVIVGYALREARLALTAR